MGRQFEQFLLPAAAALALLAAVLLAALWIRQRRANALLRGELVALRGRLEAARESAAAADNARRLLETGIERNNRLEAVGRMAAGVAHDANNQLATVRASLQTMAAAGDEALRKRCAGYVLEAAANASAMLRRIVDFSRGSSEEDTPVPVDSMLSAAVEMLRNAAGARAEVEFEDREAGGLVRGNYHALQSAVLNILLNALDALPEKGGRITARRGPDDAGLHKPGRPGRFCRISIRDNGCGMTDDVRKKIFEPFFTTKSEGKGSGLGLYTAIEAVRRAGGTIDALSEPGQGSEFVLTLPLMEEKAAGPATETMRAVVSDAAATVNASPPA